MVSHEDGIDDLTTSCPMCRSTDAKIVGGFRFLVARSIVYMMRASKQKDPEKRKSLFQMSLTEIDKACEVDPANSARHNFALWRKAQLYIAMGEGRLAIDIMTRLLSDAATLKKATSHTLLEMKVTNAEALVEVGDYASAIELLFEVIDTFTGMDLPTTIQTDTYNLHCRCWYDVGNWDFCARSGQTAVGFENCMPGVYKYLALGRKEEGNIMLALQTIGQAVLHEVDLSAGTMEENIRLFKEIEAESQRPSPLIPTVKVSPSTKRLGMKCGLCLEDLNAQTGVPLDCTHWFCYSCIKDWWTRHVRQANNKPIRFKGAQASCPLCYQQIAQLPDAERQAFLCDV
jgi:hypothetical protein